MLPDQNHVIPKALVLTFSFAWSFDTSDMISSGICVQPFASVDLLLTAKDLVKLPSPNYSFRHFLGLFSITFMMLSIIIFMVLDPNLNGKSTSVETSGWAQTACEIQWAMFPPLTFCSISVPRHFFVVNVGLGVGYTKYDIHGWGSKLYCIFFCCIMTSFFCGFLLLMISHISEVSLLVPFPRHKHYHVKTFFVFLPITMVPPT